MPPKNRVLIPGDVVTKLRLHLTADPAPDYRIAADIGVHAPILSRWATGRLPIPAYWLPVLARRLGCQPADLIGYAEITD